MSKVIDEVVFKKSIEDMLQYLSDNCLYDFVPYSDTEIADLFSLTPEEAQKLSDLISDEVVSKYKLWSSSKVNDSLIAAKSECNDYTDKMLTNISSISIKYVDTLPTSDISTSTIYILKNTGGGNDTLNLYDGGSWTVIGDFVISLDDYYKKSEMDTKLDEKANKTEVLLQDKIQTTTGAETHDNVYSAKLTKTELDLKANDDEVVKKTDISTTIDSASTDDKVPSAKAVFTPINNIQENLTSLPSIADLNNFKGKSFMIGRGTEYNNTTANFPNGVSGAFVVEYLPYYDGENYGVQRLTMVQPINGKYSTFERSLDNGNWMGWQRLCSTSVADVPLTKLTLDNSVFDTTKYSDSNISYIVRNGICTIICKGVGLVSAGTYVVASNIPKPVGGYATNILQVKNDAIVPTNPVFLTAYNTELSLFSESNIGPFWGILTYPVAE